MLNSTDSLFLYGKNDCPGRHHVSKWVCGSLIRAPGLYLSRHLHPTAIVASGAAFARIRRFQTSFENFGRVQELGHEGLEPFKNSGGWGLMLCNQAQCCSATMLLLHHPRVRAYSLYKRTLHLDHKFNSNTLQVRAGPGSALPAPYTQQVAALSHLPLPSLLWHKNIHYHNGYFVKTGTRVKQS